MDNSTWYVEAIHREIDLLNEGRFTGNIVFQVNFKEGSIANCNISLNKSLRKPDRVIKK